MGSIQIIFSPKLTKITEDEKKKYEAGILQWIFQSISYKDSKIIDEVNKWTINIYESHETPLDQWKALVDGTLNPGIPFGMTIVTSKIVNMYIPNISGDMPFLQNFFRIAHELDHMLLAIFYPNKRARRRNQDNLNPPGSEGNFYTTEVHDRLAEHKIKIVDIYRNDWKFLKSGKIHLVGIDITDLTESRT